MAYGFHAGYIPLNPGVCGWNLQIELRRAHWQRRWHPLPGSAWAQRCETRCGWPGEGLRAHEGPLQLEHCNRSEAHAAPKKSHLASQKVRTAPLTPVHTRFLGYESVQGSCSKELRPLLEEWEQARFILWLSGQASQPKVVDSYSKDHVGRGSFLPPLLWKEWSTPLVVLFEGSPIFSHKVEKDPPACWPNITSSCWDPHVLSAVRPRMQR